MEPALATDAGVGMSRLTVHASFEHPGDRWGGIGTALDLMTRASVRQQRPVALLTPSRADVLAGCGITDLRVSVPGLHDAGHAYTAPERRELGDTASRAMLSALDGLGGLERLDHGGDLDLVVHNEELVELVRAARRAPGVRVLYFAHGLASQEHPDNPTLHRQQLEVFAEPVPVAVASARQAGLLPVPAHVVHLPLELLIEPDAIGRQPQPPRFDLVAAGRGVEQKGFDLLVRALAELCPRPTCAMAVGHGGNDYLDRCRQLASDLGIQVHWLPWQSPRELRQVLDASRLLVVPSRFEPLGLIAAEAVGRGVPVVGFDVGGLGELLAATGQHVVGVGPDGPRHADLAVGLTAALAGCGRPTDSSALRAWTTRRMVEDLERSLATSEGRTR